MTWKLADAKNRLSELVNRTMEEGPQYITRRSDEFVVLTKKDYLRLKGEEPSFLEFLKSGPSLEGVDLSRPSGTLREVEL